MNANNEPKNEMISVWSRFTKKWYDGTPDTIAHFVEAYHYHHMILKVGNETACNTFLQLLLAGF